MAHPSKHCHVCIKYSSVVFLQYNKYYSKGRAQMKPWIFYWKSKNQNKSVKVNCFLPLPFSPHSKIGIEGNCIKTLEVIWSNLTLVLTQVLWNWCLSQFIQIQIFQLSNIQLFLIHARVVFIAYYDLVWLLKTIIKSAGHFRLLNQQCS